MRALKVKEVQQVAGGNDMPIPPGPNPGPFPPTVGGITWWEWEELKRRLQQQR